MNRRLFVLRLASLVVALGALAPAAHGQGAQGGPDAPAEAAARDRLGRIAREHGLASWPAAGPAVGGVPVARLELPAGFAVLERAYDARRGEVALSLGKAGGAAASTAVATVRLHATPKAAREALIAALGAMQVRAENDPAAGQLAFGVRGPDGRRRLVHGSRANVTWSVRLLDPEAKTPAPALDLVSSAIDRLVQAQPAGSPAGPRLLGLAFAAGRGRAGEANVLRLDHDPVAPAPAHAAFECTGDASVVATSTGWELLAPAAGSVEVRAFVMSEDLRVAEGTFKLAVE